MRYTSHLSFPNVTHTDDPITITLSSTIDVKSLVQRGHAIFLSSHCRPEVRTTVPSRPTGPGERGFALCSVFGLLVYSSLSLDWKPPKGRDVFSTSLYPQQLVCHRQPLINKFTSDNDGETTFDTGYPYEPYILYCLLLRGKHLERTLRPSTWVPSK